jgi:NB-ARC domain/Effector-associated domain 10
MMDLEAILDRLTKGTQTEDDVTTFRRAVTSGQINIATGKRAVAIGGNVSGAVIVTGDGNIVRIFNGSNALALQQAVGEDQMDSASATPATQQHTVATFLPSKAFRELVGRDALVDEIIAALGDSSGKWIVGVDGMGGIGKTALAREIVDRCLGDHLFDAIIWEQSPKEEFGAKQDAGSFDYESALDAIARQLGFLDVLRLKSAEKEARVKALLQSQRVLIVLDNLETARESQHEIASRLQSLLKPSKALLTSRIRFKGDVYTIHLDGLKEDGALHFIRQEAVEKRNARINTAEPVELKQITLSTGGSPLALKLVVGQVEHLPLKAVLNQLQQVHLPEHANSEDDYYRFYKAIFFPSWRLLSEDGKGLLISMSHFAPSVGGTFEAVKATSDLVDHVLTPCIDELWRLSFLEVGESANLKKVRYYLHALTQYFVLSDIVQILK